MFQSSLVAHPTLSDATPTINAAAAIRARIDLLRFEFTSGLGNRGDSLRLMGAGQ
jgi:hypothetical protein